jgi:hypothetical protein
LLLIFLLFLNVNYLLFHFRWLENKFVNCIWYDWSLILLKFWLIQIEDSRIYICEFRKIIFRCVFEWFIRNLNIRLTFYFWKIIVIVYLVCLILITAFIEIHCVVYNIVVALYLLDFSILAFLFKKYDFVFVYLCFYLMFLRSICESCIFIVYVNGFFSFYCISWYMCFIETFFSQLLVLLHSRRKYCPWKLDCFLFIYILLRTCIILI